jgi:hypothetical protein
MCLDWAETCFWADILGLKTPKVFYQGIWNEKSLSYLPIDTTRCEGYVVRTFEGFPYTAFGSHVAKWVRKGHVTIDAKWMEKEVVPNRLRSPPRALP